MSDKQPETCRQCVLYHPIKELDDGIRITGEQVKGDCKACEKFLVPEKARRGFRWMQRKFRFSVAASRVWFWCVRFPLGFLRKPIPIGWQDDFDLMNDTIIPDGIPQCPRCGDMPYSMERCMICGQRFTKEEKPDAI